MIAFMLFSTLLLGAIGRTAWRAAGHAGLMHGPVTAALGFGENWSPRAIAKTQQQGQPVITAIERFRAEHNDELPPSLDALVSEFIPAIDTPSAGDRQWRFGPLHNHEDEYFLSVRSRHMNEPSYYGIEFLQYNSLDKQWTVFRSES
ncbi:MAG: hypothetical protein Q9O74_08865 [Planctomycetota bacterium]|nr:hypothetical protein [Planctomycetota bacterium]